MTLLIKAIVSSFLLLILAPPTRPYTPTPPHPHTPKNPHTLEDVSFIAGTWQHEGDGYYIEEVWSKRSGDNMMGMFRFVQEGKGVFYEMMIVEETDEGVVLRLKHFNAGLIGWEEKAEVLSFYLTEVSGSTAVFEQKDKNKRLRYLKAGDELAVLLEERKDGEWSQEAFKFKSAIPNVAGLNLPPMPDRRVEDNVLYSSELPDIRVRVAEEFRYLGKFDFILKDVAQGERYVFVDDEEGQVKRLFIFQFEGFIPGNEYTYNYNFDRAESMGDYKWRQNTWGYSNEASARENPFNEGTLTADFLHSEGLELEDELVMSRFLMVPDDDRRHELILFYLENAGDLGIRIDELYTEAGPTKRWRELSVGLTERSRESFEIVGTSK